MPLAPSQDVLTGLLRDGARRLLAQAIEAEVATGIDAHVHLKDQTGRQQVVRNGHLPERTIQTGIGPIEVMRPRVRDLVLMRATAEGKKELIAIADGYRESEQSWKELLPDCKARGLEVEPALVIADGALRFWKAMRQVWDTTRE